MHPINSVEAIEEQIGCQRITIKVNLTRSGSRCAIPIAAQEKRKSHSLLGISVETSEKGPSSR